MLSGSSATSKCKFTVATYNSRRFKSLKGVHYCSKYHNISPFSPIRNSILYNVYFYILFCDGVYIWLTGANKAETHYLPKGVHTFPFEFSVPAGCPTTYEGSIGRVRSYVSATLEKLWIADISTLKPFTVINPLDLNTDPRAVVSFYDFCSICQKLYIHSNHCC